MGIFTTYTFFRYAPPTTQHPQHNKWHGSLGEKQKKVTITQCERGYSNQRDPLERDLRNLSSGVSVGGFLGMVKTKMILGWVFLQMVATARV